MTSNGITARRSFHRSWIVGKKPLVKRAPGYHFTDQPHTDWRCDKLEKFSILCCVHNASTVPWTPAGQFGRPRGVRWRPWYDLWRPRCVISHPMDVRGLPPGRPPSGRPRDTQFGIDWSLLPSGCPQGVRTAEVQPITARTHYGQEVGLPTVRPKPEVDVP